MSNGAKASFFQRGFGLCRSLIRGPLVILLAMTLLSGCPEGLQKKAQEVGQTAQEKMAENPLLAAALCGGGGATVGSLIGLVSSQKNPRTGAIVGGLAGGGIAGATCFAVGNLTTTPVRSYQDTVQLTGYQQTQGLRVQVRDLRVEPSAISPGQQLVVKANYVVMAPAPDAEIEVVETLTALTYDDKPEQGKRLLTLPRKISLKPGTWQYAGEPTAPKEGLGRRLQITVQVEASNKSEHQSDQKSQEVSVAIAGASLSEGSLPVNVAARPPASSSEDVSAQQPPLDCRRGGCDPTAVAMALFGGTDPNRQVDRARPVVSTVRFVSNSYAIDPKKYKNVAAQLPVSSSEDVSAQQPPLDCRRGGCDPTAVAMALFGGTDPNRQVDRARPVVLTVGFASNSYAIEQKKYKKGLDVFGEALTLPQYAERRILISGHTDSTGSRRANQLLSQRRAASVKEYLVHNYTIAPQRLVAEGFGPDKPLCKDHTPECFSQNRRIEVVWLKDGTH